MLKELKLRIFEDIELKQNAEPLFTKYQCFHNKIDKKLDSMILAIFNAQVFQFLEATFLKEAI